MLDSSEQTDIFMNSFLIQDTEEMQNVIINLEWVPLHRWKVLNLSQRVP